MLTNSQIIAEYRAKTPQSEALAEEAKTALPSGIAHDTRYLQPYGIYVERAQGPHKWDVDGNRYIDYFGGHGALLLGHNHPKVLAAMQEALAKGTHFGANHPAEVRWAQKIIAMIPCAERVRFTSSGTEATHLALRLARAYTGKRKLLRVMTHFHGWHDHMTSGYMNHFDGSPTPGVLASVNESLVLVPPEDTDALRNAFARDDDIAVAFVEPTGASFGKVPVSVEYLRVLREETAKRGVVLIFDEVISGFRVSPGGAQGQFGITPDMTTLAKIVAGGMPGGAVVGRADILERLDFQATASRGQEKIQHPGTFNANPVSAAAGLAALEIISTTDACERANRYTDEMRRRMNEVLEEEGIAWSVYGTFSGFHVFTNPHNRKIKPGAFDALRCPYEELKAANRPELLHKFQLAMLLNGVHITSWPGGLVSATHTEADLAGTIEAFKKSLRMLKEEGEIGKQAG
ncbi:MAG: aminotransferase class III-fold pyridoxal phosphate-dependent enzyme [Gammaproteobacteria bacterium]